MLVKVHNRNKHPFSQKIKGITYDIPAEGSLELDYDIAQSLVRAFSPIEVDYDGRALEKSYKKLEIDKDDERRYHQVGQNKAKGGSYICQACGYVAVNQWELKGHVTDMHSTQFDDQEQAIEGFREEAKESNVRKRAKAKSA